MGEVPRSEKKRKRVSERHDQPSKKPAVAPAVQVKFLSNRKGSAPIIASTPGVDLPSSIPLEAYIRPRQKKLPSPDSPTSNAGIASSELLLHSSVHPMIDFIGREGENELDTLRKHYLAVYDPEKGTLQVMEARKMTVRGCVRQPSPDREEETDEEVAVTASHWSQRTALTEAFGTKQSRKVAQSAAENALLSNALGDATKAAESALLSTIPKDHFSSTPQDTKAEVQAAKPLPQPNLSATHPSDVYMIETLVPNCEATLRQLPIRDWQDAISASKPILTTSRFVSHRIEAVARSKNTTHLQLLRFILILIEFSRCLKFAGGGGVPNSKKLPAREEFRRRLSGSPPGSHNQSPQSTSHLLPDSVLNSLRRKFAPHGSYLSKHDITLLHTTTCALSLHIPSPNSTPTELATDPADLSDDLRLSHDDVLHYFRELGCRVDRPQVNEYAAWGIKGGKAEAAAKRIVRLKLPLVFPKVSRGRRR